MTRTALATVVAALALTAAVSTPAVADSAPGAQASAKKKAAKCKAKAKKKANGKARKALADSATKKGKKKAARCKAVPKKKKAGKRKAPAKPAPQPTPDPAPAPPAGFVDGRYEDAANKVRFDVAAGGQAVDLRFSLPSHPCAGGIAMVLTNRPLTREGADWKSSGETTVGGTGGTLTYSLVVTPALAYKLDLQWSEPNVLMCEGSGSINGTLVRM